MVSLRTLPVCLLILLTACASEPTFPTAVLPAWTLAPTVTPEPDPTATALPTTETPAPETPTPERTPEATPTRTPEPSPTLSPTPVTPDQDGDGYLPPVDCDDGREDIHPGVTELCDGLDNNCDGQTDEGFDEDGDGVPPCGPDGDCDDSAPLVYPGAAELCNGEDDDCDLVKDENVVFRTWYADADGDSYGNPQESGSSCSEPEGMVLDGTDCNDADASIHPDATESCDGIDQDCDERIDEGAQLAWYPDRDQDGYGSADALPVYACSAVEGRVADHSDCDDQNASRHPGVAETCDGIDNDCDGTVDEEVKTAFYPDSDGDGYGASSATPALACTLPAGYVDNALDCQDGDAEVHPGAAERCDGQDQDCDGLLDEDAGSTWHPDQDQDGYGSAAVATLACQAPAGYLEDGSDCLDTDPASHPGAVERCDGRDNNCDGVVDEGGTTEFYQDADADGFGVSTSTTTGCTAPSGYSDLPGDCQDADGQVYPGAVERCNLLDDDCDSLIDEGLDQDGDGFSPCAAPVPDCDDSQVGVYPGASESCDGRDNNCDGVVDEPFLAEGRLELLVVEGATETGANGSQSHPFPKVQAAIDAANPACPRVSVRAGKYLENIDFRGKSVQVVSLEGASSTILDGGLKDSVVRMVSGEGLSARLEGFTVRGGSASVGGGIRVSASSPTILHNTITSNGALSQGGGIYLSDSQALLEENLIQSNLARNPTSSEGRGGGIYILGGHPILIDNQIKTNTSFVSGGGISIVEGSRAELIGGELRANNAGGAPLSSGGGLYISRATPTLSDVKVEGNVAAVSGAGLYVSECGSAEAECVLEDLVVSDNVLLSGGGAGIYLTASPWVRLERSQVLSNRAVNSAGGVYVSASRLNMINSLIYCNAATDAGGGLWISNSTVMTLHSTLVKNSAKSGGGIYFVTNANGATQLTLTNSVLAYNSSGVTRSGNKATYTIMYTDFWSNLGGDGSGVDLTGTTSYNQFKDPLYTITPSLCDLGEDDLFPVEESPLVDSGLDVGVTDDLEGHYRPADGNKDGTVGFDLGAWER